jgi:death on curing protein
LRNEPRWLAVEEVIETNREQVGFTGEDHLIIDLGGLQSAVNSPRNQFEYGGQDDVIVLAVSLFIAICQNHPFIQGNKRTAWLAALQFLEMNGYWVSVPDTDEIGEFLTKVAVGLVSRQFLEYTLWRLSLPIR